MYVEWLQDELSDGDLLSGNQPEFYIWWIYERMLLLLHAMFYRAFENYQWLLMILTASWALLSHCLNIWVLSAQQLEKIFMHCPLLVCGQLMLLVWVKWSSYVRWSTCKGSLNFCSLASSIFCHILYRSTSERFHSAMKHFLATSNMQSRWQFAFLCKYGWNISLIHIRHKYSAYLIIRSNCSCSNIHSLHMPFAHETHWMNSWSWTVVAHCRNMYSQDFMIYDTQVLHFFSCVVCWSIFQRLYDIWYTGLAFLF